MLNLLSFDSTQDKSPISNLDLSIIIVNYNTRQLLDDCLTSIFEAEEPAGGLEVIVVDNASSDGSQEMVREKFPTVQLIASEVNRGFSAANNLGVAVANGRSILFLNSDTRVDINALAEPVAYLLANPDVGALTVRLIYPNGERDPDNHRGFPTTVERHLPFFWPQQALFPTIPALMATSKAMQT